MMNSFKKLGSPDCRPTGTSGLSLVELMSVVAIIGVLASVSIPLYSKFMFDARVSEATELLMAAYKEQLLVADAVEAGRYPGWTAPYTEVFETNRQNVPTLTLKPKGNERFNLIIGEQNPLLVGRKAFSDFPGLAALPRVNDYGFNPINGRFLIGAEAVIDGRLQAMAVDERGTILELCNAWTGQVNLEGRDAARANLGLDPDCIAP